MAIIFRYVHIPRPDGTLRKAPFIPVYTRNRFGKLMKVVALLDSGVDNTVIPKDLANLLGLREKTSKTETTAGIGGQVIVKKARFLFMVKGNREKYNMDVPALILQESGSDVPLLLGRNGFFENFHITFKQSEEKIILKKITPRRQY